MFERVDKSTYLEESFFPFLGLGLAIGRYIEGVVPTRLILHASNDFLKKKEKGPGWGRGTNNRYIPNGRVSIP